MSVAAATISACAQYNSRGTLGIVSPSSAGSDRPVTIPSFAEWYCTTTAMAFARTRTQINRKPYLAPAVMFAATFPGST